MNLEDPVVSTATGALRGRWRTHGGSSSAAFLGVPFAQAPVNRLRFAAPVPMAPWDGVRDALAHGPTAQVRPFAEVTTIPEPSTPGDEVLNLTVVTPRPGDTTAGLPVLVWIHGGGFFAGCQNSPWYDGAAFARDGVVTVTLGYRLGGEAWLRLDGAPDNRGALDWVAGLRWVRDNIAAFGGDPGRVTIAGQSAGGGAVLTLLTMPDAQCLFARAFALSGALSPDESAAAADSLSRDFAEHTNLAPTVEGAGRLSRIGMHDALLALCAAPHGQMALRFAPCADGRTIPAPVLDSVRAGRGADKPLLIGTTLHEFNGVGDAVPDDLPVEEAVDRLCGLGLATHEATRLVAEHSGPIGRLIGQAVTDTVFRRLAIDIAGIRADRGDAPTWLYEFDWRPKAGATPGRAAHCYDLPFWWDHLDADGVEPAIGPHPPQELATAMHRAAVAFVSGEGPGWGASDADRHPVKRWGDAAGTDAGTPGYSHVIGRTTAT